MSKCVLCNGKGLRISNQLSLFGSQTKYDPCACEAGRVVRHLKRREKEYRRIRAKIKTSGRSGLYLSETEFLQNRTR